MMPMQEDEPRVMPVEKEPVMVTVEPTVSPPSHLRHRIDRLVGKPHVGRRAEWHRLHGTCRQRYRRQRRSRGNRDESTIDHLILLDCLLELRLLQLLLSLFAFATLRKASLCALEEPVSQPG